MEENEEELFGMFGITYLITADQAKTICEHFGKNVEEMEDSDICGMLDEIINHLA